ncbi:hypothetical protein CTEN210_11622 [Chaetoceros tenuissimus]|uniref:Reverse transcriptase domain-containing protein n=1 Tax=Chaetoceros tenuissimus TaxID=426638 RepID=A0AAD3D1M7_9STRA|nr:hypothetical protein CTEN210_11622 [Chaetoceros tenuissimus]
MQNASRKVGWRKFIQIKRGRVDLATTNINHPAGHVLNQYRKRGVPVRFKTKPWSKERIDEALQRGSHRSCFEYLDFLEEEFVDMMQKGQWIILPFEDVQSLPNLRLSPPGVVPQRERRPRWIVDYSFYNINEDTLPLVLDSMQFGHALDRILREILLSNPNHGPVQLMKVDLSDGFYRLCLNIDDIPKLGVTFPSATHNNLVAFPLVLPMGWKNSPPAFCTATETIADLANRSLQAGSPSAAHPLSKHAAPMDGPISPPTATATALQPPFVSATTLNSSLSQTDIPTVRDPSLPFPMTLLQYIDVFVDDFIALAQTGNRNYVRDTLLHAIDTVFRPNDFYDSEYRREPVSLKKLRKGDCSWSTIKLVLGWIINTVAMTIELPQHRQERLGAILSSIPSTQKRIGVKKWHKLLGELRSMALALPGARCMFGMMQEALRSLDKRSRISLRKGVHQSIADFQWMLKDISKRPTRIAELVPLLPSALGFHDASGEGAGGVWFPSHTIGSRMKNKNTLHPLLWRYKWPQDIIDDLVTEDNPQGKITNSDLELAGGLLHLDVIAHCLDVRERTLVSKTDNLATLFWERKGSATNAAVTHQLLRLFGIHQRFHRYVPRHDYISGPSNPLADDSSQIHLQNCAPDTKADFWRDLGFAEQEVRQGVTTGRSAASDTHWEKWIEFTSVLGQDPLLQTVEDKVPYLQVFLHRVRHGFYAANKNPIRARSAEDYLRSIGQTYLELGEQDPRLNCHDNIDFRLARMIKSYKKKDPPPNRVKPVPLSVIRRIAQIAFSGNSFNQHATADMIIIAFFFLLRPGEYSYSNTDSDPFLLADVQFWIGHQRLNTMTATPTQLRQATFVSLTFTTQKNGVRGEVIGLSCSGEFYLCPVKALARRVIHLKQHNAAPNTPLCTYFCQERQRLVHVCPSDITNTLRTNVAALGPALGFLPSDVSARCLRAAGANALLCANVDSDVIRLLGRWRSDEMLRYLHLQNSQLMQHFSQRMLTGGNFTLIPNQEVPLF